MSFSGAATTVIANLAVWVWLGAALFVWRTTTRRPVARRIGAVGLALIWLMGCRPVAEALLRPLENAYPQPTVSELRRREVRDIVVLTGGGYLEQGELLSSALPHASAHRFLGGIELCARFGSDCRLIFSGAAGRERSDVATAETMAELARRLLPEASVDADILSASTAEHPDRVRALLGSNRDFVLVTSGYHMLRAVRSFERAGLDPIPFPVDTLCRGDYSYRDWMPSAESFWVLNVGFREVLALVFYSIMGW